ncbi:MAG: UDP-N-acetylmuramoyl-L-alanine--D-glutamate ligase [Candidatus Omnitrophica bacterium CG07_land_8_20_14_0_80_50_8]|nr:MAG: UDP-N-acetylmuramoyl-L-alanine--D-glutamate ligase [Candidatus Omnitrophica bacterium CG07_land_8_20_14_0_80_50_8]
MNLKNKKITVIGLGKSGFAAAKFLKGQGARVRVTEGAETKAVLESADFLTSLDIPVETGRHTAGFMRGSDLIVTSPGVSKKSSPLQFAMKRKLPVISEIELASYFCPGLIVAVTGSNGKTTAIRLIDRALREARRKSVLCGNVGASFLDALPSIDKKSVVVVELSSFQLEDSPTFRPRIAVVLNISPNHLDRHGSMEKYIMAKEKIFANQQASDFLILNFDDPLVRAMAKKVRSKVVFFSKHRIAEGFFVEDGKVVNKKGKSEKTVLDCSRAKLKGSHNLENILAALAVASILKVPRDKIQNTVYSFETLEHRIEHAGTVGGVHFINDSKSTTVESAKAAILSVDAPMVLIAGGRNKGTTFESLEPLLEKKVKCVVLYGEARAQIAGAWKTYKRVHPVKDFCDAVRLAYRLSDPGDSILLSPMCASFDQFSCFEERGTVFKQISASLGRSSKQDPAVGIS